MSRRLSPEEEGLWDRLRATVRPLRRRKVAPPTVRNEQQASARDIAEKPDAGLKRRSTTDPAGKTESGPPALAPLEEKTLRRLGRGLVEVDARIDLHGMRQERAFSTLASFLRHAQARGHRIVLVVTGKGRGEERPIGEGRGVLRHAVPEWLARDDLRAFVVGFEEAHRRHGGAGALYVRIRRRREARDRRPRG